MDTDKTFRDMLDDIAKEEKYEDYSLTVSPISSGGANFTTALYTGVISAPNKEDLHLFGKVANVSDKLREEVFSAAIYDVERIAYKELVEIYKKIEDKHDIPEEDRLALPKIYGFNSIVGKETVVLEDMAAKGFSVYDRLKSVDWQYASKAIELLAKFHALSMVYAEEYPDSFQKHCEKLSSLLSNLYDPINKGREMMMLMSLAVVKEENKDKLKAFFDKQELMDFSQIYKTVRKPVLVHADFKQSNLMHRYNEDGSMDMVLLDLQTIQPSSAVMDLLLFIFTGTDAAFRKEYYSKLLDHYYDTLSRLLTAYGLNPDKIYSREEFDYELQERLHYGLIIAVFTLPIVTVESQDAPDQSSEDLNIEDFDLKLGSTFPERINGVIDDFVRWGII